MSERSKEELARMLDAMSTGRAQGSDEPAEPEDVVAPAFADYPPPPAPAADMPPAPAQPQRAVFVRRRQHLVQTLAFKRTIIPVLLTLGVLCPGLGLVGFFVSPLSPFGKLAEWWFSVPFLLIGVVMLVLAVLTMLQVRHEMTRRRM